MHIRLQRNAGVPIVKQIYQEIADRIRSGLLEEGALLPSVRTLSKQLNVSPMTTVRAYNQLESDGYIVREQGKGTFVKRTEKREEKQKRRLKSQEWQLSIPDYLPRAQYWRQQQLFQTDNLKLPLSVASIHPSLLPQQEFNREVQKLLQNDSTPLFQYGPIEGDLEFRKAAANYLSSRNLSLKPEEILVTNGSQQAIDLIARCFVGQGDVVVTEAPTYSTAIDVFRERGATIIPIPVDQEGMRIDSLITLCDTHPPKVIYTIPDYQNPTGAVMSPRRRSQLLEIAQVCQSVIVEDDPWSETSFTETAPAPIKAQDQEGHVVYIKGFSKILSPGCRVGAAAASGRLMDRLVAAKANADLGSPLLTQRAVASFIRSPQMPKHIKRLKTALKKRRNKVIELLSNYAPQHVTWTVPSGGINIWITLPGTINADELVYEAKKESLSFLPGSSCYPGQPEFHHLRISYSYLEENQLELGIRILCHILSSSSAGTIATRFPVF
ncbi:PLP-dependent aminotransferase family protein [Paenactinomyces guangxiensis]|uniref:PLP-dependent aminotransferase family protein n=1 Tax=Paenactinomyces guangxiensis TaxID=1490290 RepID=A0A7W2A965_9BACL|nr:PLP-dependent aminotransferase family protein [Paenactinomyces guangxiensis]MBA4494899.1 PLP-dependent aminotransferase family protein [Paenactinomyces guangxiensis]MBH8591982.1 PLP-dependent aminotransferase family protein [Paenactinomyces guangxiensis]